MIYRAAGINAAVSAEQIDPAYTFRNTCHRESLIHRLRASLYGTEISQFPAACNSHSQRLSRQLRRTVHTHQHLIRIRYIHLHSHTAHFRNREIERPGLAVNI